jgi:hypothetical protein
MQNNRNQSRRGFGATPSRTRPTFPENRKCRLPERPMKWTLWRCIGLKAPFHWASGEGDFHAFNLRDLVFPSANSLQQVSGSVIDIVRL